MKKSDLKTGMLVETRKGEFGIVLLGTRDGDAVCGNFEKRKTTTWNPLDSYNDDLTSCFGASSDIIKVYSFSSNAYAFYFSLNNRKLLWERKEEPKIQEFTIEEIAAKLNLDPKKN